MRICAAWLLRQRSYLSAYSDDLATETDRVFMSGRCSLTRILRSPGRGFLAWTRV